jgi:small subunit ribosomal protein S7
LTVVEIVTSGRANPHLLIRELQICQRDEEGRQKAPEVIKEEINDKNAAENTTFENLLALGQMRNVVDGRELEDPVALDGLGHKFGLPELPLASNNNLKYRYDPVVSQVTNLLMKHGKKGVAQRVGSSVSL